MTCFRAVRGRHIIHCSNIGFIRPHEACLCEQMTNIGDLITGESTFLHRQFEANLSCSLRDYSLICIVLWCSSNLYQQVIHDDCTGLPSKQLFHRTMIDPKSEDHSKRVRRKLCLSNRELKVMSSEDPYSNVIYWIKRREHCGTGNAWGAIFNCRHRIVESFERLVEVFWINADVNVSIFLCSDHLWYSLRRLLYRCDHSDFGHLDKFLLTLFSLTWGTLRGGLKTQVRSGLSLTL